MTDETNRNAPAPGAEGAPEGQAAPADGAAPEAAGDGIESLRREIETLKTQSAEFRDGWQRARADFANYKRRVEKEQSETYQNASARVITRFLEVQDDFDRAMQERPASFDDRAVVTRWLAGIELIQRKLQNILDAEGVERIEAEGRPFDPTLHEAVTHEDSDTHEPGAVIGVVRHGYRIGERVIRPAMVRVAK